METLPALLLVVAILIISLNMERIRLRLAEAGAEQSAKIAAFDQVSAKWEENPDSRAALSSWVETGDWNVIDLPDEHWLPLSTGDSGRSTLWRRHPLIGDEGQVVWLIEIYHPRAERWRWWSDAVTNN